MTSKEILDQIEGYKKKKGNAEGKVQVLSKITIIASQKILRI